MPMTRLGIGSYALAWSIGVPGFPAPQQPLDHAGLLDVAEELGVKVVQYADNLPLDRLGGDELEALSGEARRKGITLEAGTRGILPAHLRQYLEIAQRLGSEIVRVVIDTADHRPTPDETITLLRQVLPEYERGGVTLAVENHDRFKSAILAEIIRRCESPRLGICLDTVNSFGALEGPEVVIANLGPLTVNLHYKDFRIRRLSHNMGFVVEGAPAGQGMLNGPWLLERLNELAGKAEGRFNTIIELWPVPEGSVADTTAKEMAWLRQSVRYLRTLIKD
jgi:3-oxoisoapionate decarboxylase